MLTEEECDSYGGIFQGEAVDCDPNPCLTSDVVENTRGAGALGLRVIPSPARGSATIQYELPGGGSVRIEVFDSSGRLIRRMCRGALEAGLHSLMWDGRDGGGCRAVSGVYFVRLRTSNGSMVQPLVLVR